MRNNESFLKIDDQKEILREYIEEEKEKNYGK